jgi:hypothetical protein
VASFDLLDLDAEESREPVATELLEGLDVRRHYLPAWLATYFATASI